jgi:7SK snRNA methylphosphate capping enzyme
MALVRGGLQPALPTQGKKSRAERNASGSYSGYYKRNRDTVSRLREFDRSWFRGKECLDVGCNEGAVTMFVAEKFQPCSIVGIDVDKLLILAAQSSVKRAVYDHRQAQKKSGKTPIPVRVTSEKASTPTPVASSSAVSTYTNSIQMKNGGSVKMPAMNTFVPRTVSMKRKQYESLNNMKGVNDSSTISTISGGGGFPYNVSFEAESFANFSGSINFDVILALSITKWVHLNEGDTGLLGFFRKIFKLLREGGRAIIEYQPWKSYERNRSASDVTKSNFHALQIRPEDFEYILSEGIGFRVEHRLGAAISEAKGFNRPILVLTKPAVTPATVAMLVTDDDMILAKCRNRHGQRAQLARVPSEVGATTLAPEDEEHERTTTGPKRKRSLSVDTNAKILEDYMPDTEEWPQWPDHNDEPSMAYARRQRINL